MSKNETVQVPEWVQDLVAEVLPHITKSTQFALGVEHDPNMGKSKRDGEKTLTIGNAKCFKTLKFETDGKYVDGPKSRYKDGTVCERTVTGFNYIVIENAMHNAQGESSITTTCYVKDKVTLLALRQAVGLVGW
jgi:hypothetical protein